MYISYNISQLYVVGIYQNLRSEVKMRWGLYEQFMGRPDGVVLEIPFPLFFLCSSIMDKFFLYSNVMLTADLLEYTTRDFYYFLDIMLIIISLTGLKSWFLLHLHNYVPGLLLKIHLLTNIHTYIRYWNFNKNVQVVQERNWLNGAALFYSFVWLDP